MALTLFFRTDTGAGVMDATHDYTAGDNDPSTTGTPSASGSAAKIGSYGMLTNAATSFWLWSSASIITIDQGSMGCWVQWKTSISTTGQALPLRAKNAATNDYITLQTAASNEIDFRLRAASGSELTLTTTAANFVVDNWYFLTASWHLSADKRRLRVYNSSGTLIEEIEDTSTDLSGCIPAAIDTFYVGNMSSRTDAMWIDNVFVGDSYDDADTFLTKRDITSYTEYNPAPTFDTSPTVTSQTATAYTLTYDADANATNIYVGIYLKDATAPTAAQIKAGTNAHGTATEATTGASDTITVTASESPAFPIYDVYAVLEGAGGFSSVVALVDEALDPAAGKQHITVDVPWGASEESILDGASPAAVDGDIIVIDTHVDSAEQGADAHVLTCAADGVVSVDPGLDTSRLDFYSNVYDVSAGGWLNASPVRDFINNVAPVWTHPTDTFLYKKDTAIATLTLEAKFTDQEGDALTITLQDSLPAGLSFGSEQITGTPTAYGRTVVTVRATDITAEYTDHDITIEVGDELPDVVGNAQATAEATIGGTASWTTAISTAYSATVPLGNVISMDPVATTLVPHDQEVTLTVSLGASGVTRPRANRGRMGRGLLRPGGR